MPNPVRKDILKNWNVVVVDDEPDSLVVAQRILKYYGAIVHKATNGQEGLDMVRQVRPRFVISDLSMPVMDGWEMLSALKQDRATINIPVIALTAHAMLGDRERAMAAGFHNHLTKPLTAGTFMRDLLTVLDEIPALAADLSREG
ncbi:MAG: response regulator [Anaerolineae bacterium]|nr:response regulator [Anaerolineae bacterium]